MLHGQFSDLGVQVVNDRVVIFLAAASGAGEHFLQTRLPLPLPAADLVRMYFVLGRDRLDRVVPAQRFSRYLGFELRSESASFRRYPVGPPHGLEYTLTSCPIFRHHLSNPWDRRLFWRCLRASRRASAARAVSSLPLVLAGISHHFQPADRQRGLLRNAESSERS